MYDFSNYNFGKVMDYPDDPTEFCIFDFAKGYNAEFIRSQGWGIGRYNERRSQMYETDLFDNDRNIHMGIDIWAGAGEPVYSFWKGKVVYMQVNDNAGDYGPTIVVEYKLNNSLFYGLYGHLSNESMNLVAVGDHIQKGQQIATLGDANVNGGWVPHLHFQLSVEDPKEADMPGVVAEENRQEALKKYLDPRLVLGDLY